MFRGRGDVAGDRGQLADLHSASARSGPGSELRRRRGAGRGGWPARSDPARPRPPEAPDPRLVVSRRGQSGRVVEQLGGGVVSASTTREPRRLDLIGDDRVRAAGGQRQVPAAFLQVLDHRGDRGVEAMSPTRRRSA